MKFMLPLPPYHIIYLIIKLSRINLITSRNQPKCNHSIYNYMRLVVVCDWIWEHLQLQNQISIILVILTTMMQLLKFSSY